MLHDKRMKALPIEIDLPAEKSSDRSYWQPFALRTKASPEELVKMLRKQGRKYLNADFHDCIEAIMRGALRHVDISPMDPLKNSINYELIRETWGSRLVDGHTAAHDGVLRYMAVGTNNADPSSGNANLANEFYRSPPLSKKNTGPQQKFILHLDFDQANLDNDTTVTSAVSTTVFTVSSITGFHTNAAIRVAGDLTSFSRILSISGNTITLDPDQPLSQVPSPGDVVNLCIGGTASYGGTDATATLQSGHPYAISKLRIYKNSDLAYFIKQTFIRSAL